MYRRSVSLFLLALSSLLLSCSGSSDTVACLDKELGLKETYRKAFLDKVGAMKNMRTEGMPFAEEYRLNSLIAEEYSSYSFDSTMTYLEMNHALSVK